MQTLAAAKYLLSLPSQSSESKAALPKLEALIQEDERRITREKRPQETIAEKQRAARAAHNAAIEKPNADPDVIRTRKILAEALGASQ